MTLTLTFRIWPWSNVIKPMEIPYLTCYLMATVTFTLHHSKIFIVEIWMTWTLTFTMAKAKCKYASRKPIHDSLFDNNNNFYLICHHFKTFIVEMCMTSTLTFRIGQDDFPFIFNSNLYHSCHFLRDSHTSTFEIDLGIEVQCQEK